jgi:hypothetical protein
MGTRVRALSRRTQLATATVGGWTARPYADSIHYTSDVAGKRAEPAPPAEDVTDNGLLAGANKAPSAR